MIRREQLLEIISGRRRGCWAALIRFGLGTLTPVYRLVVAIRNCRFDRAARHPTSALIHRIAAPVISVGNLTTGGTGKTPLVIYLCEWLSRRGRKVAIISRGYGTPDASSPNDEALELGERLPDVPHLQSPDRVRVAQQAVNEFGSEVVVLDDGFQHRRLHRDLDIVLLDCTNPFGFGRVLPRGLLREPMSSLKRCQAVVLTRCELVSEPQREQLKQQVRQLNPRAVLAGVQTAAAGWMQFQGSRFPLEHLNTQPTQPVYAVCAIGNPQGFFATLKRLGLNLTGQDWFADHHPYSVEDLSRIAAAARNSGAAAILCTHKDLVKIRTDQIGGLPVYGLRIETQFLFGQSELEQSVLQVAERLGDHRIQPLHTSPA